MQIRSLAFGAMHYWALVAGIITFASLCKKPPLVHPLLLHSLSTGLGLFGIIYEVTFRVQATETVSVINTYEQVSIIAKSAINFQSHLYKNINYWKILSQCNKSLACQNAEIQPILLDGLSNIYFMARGLLEQ